MKFSSKEDMLKLHPFEESELEKIPETHRPFYLNEMGVRFFKGKAFEAAISRF